MIYLWLLLLLGVIYGNTIIYESLVSRVYVQVSVIQVYSNLEDNQCTRRTAGLVATVVSRVMHYINLRYLLTYLLTY